MMGNILLKSAVHDLGIQWALFLVANALKTEKFYDLAGSGTYIYLTYKSLQWGQKYFLRQKVQSALVSVWAFRLGYFLFTRVLKAGSDGRFDKVKHRPKVFFMYWTIQALWVFLTLLPTLILNSKQTDRPISRQDYIGWALWGVGFLTEVIADHQKSIFRSNPENTGRFITSGLWSISRHPNYLGEIILWIGMFISASSGLEGLEPIIGAVSPVFVTFLLTQVSGIPILERRGLKTWGADPEYQTYIKNTAKLIPFVW